MFTEQKLVIVSRDGRESVFSLKLKTQKKSKQYPSKLLPSGIYINHQHFFEQTK